MTPLLALRAAIRERCAGDPALIALLGEGVAILDEPPRGAAPAYCLFGDAEAREHGDSSGRSHAHELALIIWARPGSAASALAAGGRIAELLDDAALTLAGHRLVLMTVQATAIDRDRETNLARVTMRLTAVTEVTGS